MSFGMTYEQYWDGDVSAHRMYRKAMKEKTIYQNRMMWLQGLYIYEALLGVAVYNKAFSKAKPKPYRDEPIDLYAEERARREKREQMERFNRIKEKVEAFAKAFNGKRNNQTEGVDENARREFKRN